MLLDILKLLELVVLLELVGGKLLVVVFVVVLLGIELV